MGVFSFLSKKKQDPIVELDAPVTPRRSRSSKKTQDEEPMDPMLPEKKRARRRLVGATALVLAAVIGLPMVFDSEPKPLADDIAIQIPPRDKTSDADLNPMPLPPSSTLPEAADDGKSAAAPDTAAASPRVEPAQPQDKPAASVQAAGRLADKPVDKTPEKTADKPAEKPAAKIADKDKGRFVVQVAAVGSKAKAEELENRLKKVGIKAYHQKVSTRDGERFRVRVGPFGSRDEADKMRARLTRLGLSGTTLSI